MTRPMPMKPAKMKPMKPNTGRGIPQADVSPAVVITSELPTMMAAVMTANDRRLLERSSSCARSSRFWWSYGRSNGWSYD